MKIFERYIERNSGICLPVFSNHPQVIVIIPVLNDPDIFTTLDSLCHCSHEAGEVGVIIVVNHGINSKEEVKRENGLLAGKLRRYTEEKQRVQSEISFVIIEAFDLPEKYAGVGLARKIAMDSAMYYFFSQEKFDSPIVSLDADTWVDVNYTDEILRYFQTHSVAGVSIAYAHRLKDCSMVSYDAMVKYELYLRYYQMALEITGHPHAFHCIGSAFAVRTLDYVAQGGMNKRQAGEDFYFLQKLISTGRYAILKTTKVYPSARFSDRTPFGTGQSVRQIVVNGGEYPVYHFEAFRALKCFFKDIATLYKAHDVLVADYFVRQAPGIRKFLLDTDGMAMVAEVNANCASLPLFKKRFFDYFNAFRVLKYLNYVHGNFYTKVDISEALKALFEEMNYPYSTQAIENLDFLRKL